MNIKGNHSGRDMWWEVYKSEYGTSLVMYKHKGGEPAWAQNHSMEALEKYVVKRAEAGCPDCISAILECPEDTSLQYRAGGIAS